VLNTYSRIAETQPHKNTNNVFPDMRIFKASVFMKQAKYE